MDVKAGIPIVGSTLLLSKEDENLKRIYEIYGKTHKIEAIKGTEVDLKLLEDEESVAYGDGEFYYFKLTPLK